MIKSESDGKADIEDLKSSAERRTGSNPVSRTNLESKRNNMAIRSAREANKIANSYSQLNERVEEILELVEITAKQGDFILTYRMPTNDIYGLGNDLKTELQTLGFKTIEMSYEELGIAPSDGEGPDSPGAILIDWV